MEAVGISKEVLKELNDKNLRVLTIVLDKSILSAEDKERSFDPIRKVWSNFVSNDKNVSVYFTNKGNVFLRDNDKILELTQVLVFSLNNKINFHSGDNKVVLN